MSMADRDGLIWYDGKLVPWRDATTHVLTHTLHYGMGVFEGVRAYQTAPGHLRFSACTTTPTRLFDSAKITSMEIPFSKDDDRRSATRRGARQQPRRRATSARWCSTAPRRWACAPPAQGARHRSPPGPGAPTWRRSARTRHPRPHQLLHPPPRQHLDDAAPRPTPTTSTRCWRCRRRSPTATTKRCCSTRRATSPKAPARTSSSCATASCYTPELTSCLNGITRDTMFASRRRARLPVVERRITRDEVYIADEAFFTGTAAEVTPDPRAGRPRRSAPAAAARSPRSCRTAVLRHGATVAAIASRVARLGRQHWLPWAALA